MVTNANRNFIGLSTDTKPTNVANGSKFVEMDTGKTFFYDKDNNQWREFSGITADEVAY